CLESFLRLLLNVLLRLHVAETAPGGTRNNQLAAPRTRLALKAVLNLWRRLGSRSRLGAHFDYLRAGSKVAGHLVRCPVAGEPLVFPIFLVVPFLLVAVPGNRFGNLIVARLQSAYALVIEGLKRRQDLLAGSNPQLFSGGFGIFKGFLDKLLSQPQHAFLGNL